jgi:hypothetical protein
LTLVIESYGQLGIGVYCAVPDHASLDTGLTLRADFGINNHSPGFLIA